jgi:NifU-like protein involved in Fe-S cluster formation
MRILHISHPDQVDELPAGFASWVIAWDATEKQAEKERQKAEEARQANG